MIIFFGKKEKTIREKGADFHCENNLVLTDFDYTHFKKLSIVDILEKFIDDKIDYIVHETERYALFPNYPDPKIEQNKKIFYLGSFELHQERSIKKIPLTRNYSINVYFSHLTRRNSYVEHKSSAWIFHAQFVYQSWTFVQHPFKHLSKIDWGCKMDDIATITIKHRSKHSPQL